MSFRDVCLALTLFIVVFGCAEVQCDVTNNEDLEAKRESRLGSSDYEKEGGSRSGKNHVGTESKSRDGISSIDLPVISRSSCNILAVFPYQGKSHQMYFEAIISILMEQGCHVTLVTSFEMKGDHKNLKQILFKPAISSWADIFEFEEQTTRTSWGARVDLEKLSESFLFPLYACEGFRKILSGNEKFDLILLEPFFMQEPLVFLGHRFNCPMVAIATAATETNQDMYMGRTRNPALEVEWTTCATQPTINYQQRFINTFSWFVNLLENRFYYLPKREADMFARLSYPGMEDLPPVRQLLRGISLTIANTHQLLQRPTALPPNLLHAPGLNIEPNATLPQDIGRLMDSAKDGVILFAMGTMVPVSKMKSEREIFIKTFSKLPQLVLWKSDIDLTDLPSNVRTFKWLPQQAILNHEKCILFITHGGMNSKQEAIYYGVPLVSIPLFGDQLANTGHSQSFGLGLTILYNDLTVDKLVDAVNKVIRDPQYKERLRKYSSIFREAVSQSRSKIAYWVSHVMRHEGADYLRLQETNLYWFQYYLLDVLLVYFLILILAITVLIKIAQALYRIRFSPPSQNTKIKNQ